MRPLSRDRAAFEPGRVGRVRLLRVALKVLLGVASAPGVHTARPAGRVGVDRCEGRRTRDVRPDPREHPGAARSGTRATDHDRGQELLRPHLRSRPRRLRDRTAASGPQGRETPTRATVLQTLTPGHRVDQPDPQGPTRPRTPRREEHRRRLRPRRPTHPGHDPSSNAARVVASAGLVSPSVMA